MASDGVNRTGGLFGALGAAGQMFGFALPQRRRRGRPKTSLDNEPKAVSFAAPEPEEGGAILAGGIQTGGIQLDQIAKEDIEMISKYRDISSAPEVETAIDDIINEAVVYDENELPLKLDTSQAESLEDSTRDKINEAFKKVLQLYDVKNRIYEIFRRWYVDSRLFYNIIIDPSHPEDGILELRYIDPMFMQKVTEIDREISPEGIPLVTDKKEYYIYDNTLQSQYSTGQKNITASNFIDSSQQITLAINYNAIVYVPSGLYDIKNKRVMGYLQKAIRPLNQLRMVEDSLVIYRLARAPERRVFYVDVGNLPKTRAEEYMKSLMNRYRNRMIYDTNTGETRDDKRFMSIIEDYWMPRREGNKGTEISTLPGGQNLGELSDVEYFLKKLYKALNVPFSRNSEVGAAGALSQNRSSDILREELKFAKFVARLRMKFVQIFIQALRMECILTGILTEDEWDDVEDDLNIYFINESSYKEIKDLETVQSRLEALERVKPYVGQYFSHAWVRRNILRQTEDEIDIINKEQEDEKRRGDIQTDEEV